MQYGGLSRAGDLENGPPKPASEFTIKGGEKVFLEIDGIEVYTFPKFAYSERNDTLSDCWHLQLCIVQICVQTNSSDSSGRKETTWLKTSSSVLAGVPSNLA